MNSDMVRDSGLDIASVHSLDGAGISSPREEKPPSIQGLLRGAEEVVSEQKTRHCRTCKTEIRRGENTYPCRWDKGDYECKKCNNRSCKEWQRRNPEKYRAYSNKRNRELRREVLDAYGQVCECCGETREEFLTIDHIDGKGAEHRREIGIRGGTIFYKWLKKNGFPKDNFRALCRNCNGARGAYGYCPHEKERASKLEAL